eukprot:jgi/Mesen1/2659/ME000167S01810
MVPLRCRGCDRPIKQLNDCLLCPACLQQAAGVRRHVTQGVWKTKYGVSFGRMTRISELLDEARSRTLLVLVFIAVVAYALSLTSASVLVNVPLAILLVAVMRRLSFEFEIRWKHQPAVLARDLQPGMRQVSAEEALLGSNRGSPGGSQWRRAVDCPRVEAALSDLIHLLLKEFVTDMFYAYLTPDKDLPLEVRATLLHAAGEVAARVKRVNLVALLTRDVPELVGSHLELYRRTREHAGGDALDSLSSAEREQRLQQALSAAGEIHPACVSPELEYMVCARSHLLCALPIIYGLNCSGGKEVSDQIVTL